MTNDQYLRHLKSALSPELLHELTGAGFSSWTGITLDSAVIKIYKPAWSSDLKNPVNPEGRIFFSIWVNEESAGQQRLCYNIHAFKVRLIKGYKIPAREFAQRFREEFRKQPAWPHATTEFGPLTLMEGWIPLKAASLQQDAAGLVKKFLSISPIIDSALARYRTIKRS